MKKYLYTAKIQDQMIECTNIPQLTEKINAAVGFPVVSNNSLYNHFSRPHVVKTKKFDVLELRRHDVVTTACDQIPHTISEHHPQSCS
jgi:hypothetical protein|eukprot:COSAG03_NODE_3493_length_1983_cov_1.383227_2_plen_88_part_00